MKNLILVFIGLFLIGGLSSCKKRGCTINYAKNFDATAKKDNQSCEFYYTAQVSGIKVMNFPDFDQNGEDWDIGDAPDLYIRITNQNDDIKYQTQKISNINPNDTVDWAIPEFVKIDSSAPEAQFKIYEVDDLAAELIEKFPINFIDYMHQSKSGFDKYPDSIAFSTDSVSMKIYLNWVE